MPPNVDRITNMSDTSITTWIQRVRSSDDIAAQRLWERYVHRLVEIARLRLGHVRAVADEEDVVVVAFEKFLRAVSQNRFPKLNDRHDLWQVLVLLTERAAVDQYRKLTANRRGGGKVEGDPIGSNDSECDGVRAIVDREPTPEFAVLAAEQYKQLLDTLDDDELRAIAVAKMEGMSNREISAQADLGLRSVERKLNLIRSIWMQEGLG